MAAMLLIALVAGYTLGAIPSGVVICRALGKDPRQVGSGRTGGTNVYRTAGFAAGLLTFVADVAKGGIAVMLATRLAGAPSFSPLASPEAALAASLAALAAILGHNHSIFLGFAGGAGSSPNLGALLAFDPVTALFSLAVSAAVLFGTGVASVASLTLSGLVVAALLFRVILQDAPAALLVYGLGQLMLVSWALRPNIARLLAGTERGVSFGRLGARRRADKGGDAESAAEPDGSSR